MADSRAWDNAITTSTLLATSLLSPVLPLVTPPSTLAALASATLSTARSPPPPTTLPRSGPRCALTSLTPLGRSICRPIWLVPVGMVHALAFRRPSRSSLRSGCVAACMTPLCSCRLPPLGARRGCLRTLTRRASSSPRRRRATRCLRRSGMSASPPTSARRAVRPVVSALASSLAAAVAARGRMIHTASKSTSPTCLVPPTPSATMLWRQSFGRCSRGGACHRC